MLKIYQLTSEKADLNYIGRTGQSLKERLRKHKCAYRRWLNEKKHWKSSFHIIQHDDVKIELIEEVDNTLWEYFWIQNSDCCNYEGTGELFISKEKDKKYKLGFIYKFEIKRNKKNLVRTRSTNLEKLKLYRDKWLMDNYHLFDVN